MPPNSNGSPSIVSKGRAGKRAWREANSVTGYVTPKLRLLLIGGYVASHRISDSIPTANFVSDSPQLLRLRHRQRLEHHLLNERTFYFAGKRNFLLCLDTRRESTATHVDPLL